MISLSLFKPPRQEAGVDFWGFFQNNSGMEKPQEQRAEVSHGGKRAGAGRPRLLPSQTIKIGAEVPVALCQALDHWAADQGLSRASAVRIAIERLTTRGL